MSNYDWYSFMRCPQWMCWYAKYTGHFVDDFGNMVRVYAPDEQGYHAFMN